MQVVHNIFVDVGDGTTRLKVVSGAYEDVVVTVPTVFVPDLKKFNWCFEPGKGQLYTMDFSLTLAKIFGFTCPRVYLWRYVVYLQTGDPKIRLPRKNLSDYTVQNFI